MNIKRYSVLQRICQKSVFYIRQSCVLKNSLFESEDFAVTLDISLLEFIRFVQNSQHKRFSAQTKRLYLSSILACTKHDYKPIILVNVLSKGKNREQNSSHTMNIGSTLLRTYCLFLFTFFLQKKEGKMPNVIKLRNDEPSRYYFLDGIFI